MNAPTPQRLRKFQTVAIFVTIALFAVSGTAETNINLLLGGKSLDSEDWPIGDKQASFGIMTTFGPESWPVQIAIDSINNGSFEEGFRLSIPDGEDIRGRDRVQSSGELDLGVRKTWQRGKMRPYVGGGVGLMWARQERFLKDWQLLNKER